ncbi:MAG: phosphomannomutase/phosphoglucomutase [Candidatus Thiodiazotropha sp. (ex Lucinoma borealis)]|nr:phosphomannomutase/phosphoglucomutase [Candidatus Thiodiazotropha sp. (ex Lucinoma borealis)]MCU7866909.1 phosphomannomutase/phosphoglucomutase [Candidatus Thiodiazotropha sp. (ex Lucinoma borealis)]
MGFTKKTGEQKIQQGSGRSIRGYWTIGVIGLLILTAAVWSYLFYQNQLTTQAQQKKQTKAITQALAISITTILKQRMELIQGLAHQPALAELFDQVDTQDLQVEQARLTRLVPDVMRIRLLPKGVEQPDTDAKPHMGYASLQLLRQAEESETVLPAEMHQFGTTHQHIAIASSIPSTNGVDVSGVLHAAFPTDTLLKLLDGIEDYAGRVELQQVFAGKEPFALAGKGAIVATGDRPDGVIPLKGSIWQIAYWGGTGTGMQADLIESLMLIVPGVLFFLFTALLLFRLSQRMTNALKSDQHNILSLMEALVVGRPPKHQPAQLSDLQPTLDVLEHQVREYRSNQAEKGKIKRSASDISGLGISDMVVKDEGASIVVDEMIDIPSSIFRAYDIRGVVGETITEEIVTQLGQGIGSEVYEKGYQSVVVARDTRTSSDSLQSALIQGLQASGRDVIDLGMVPTPLLNYAVHELDAECGVMVTGSHNPAQYNGLKLVVGRESPTQEDIQDLRRLIDAGQLLQGEGSFDSQEIENDYIERVISDVRLGQPLKIVVDCGNGAASAVAPELYRQLGCEVVELYCTADGTFPNHHPDPGDPKNMRDLQKAVIDHQAALGLAFDGDGDRLGVIDSSGKLIWPDRLLMYLAIDILTREPGGDIIYDVKCSRHLANIVLSNGGRPLMWKSGHSMLKAKMKETHALLAGEFSGHILFSERWYGFDDGIYAGARLLEILSLDYRTSAEIFAELPESLSTPEYVLQLEEGQPQTVMSAIDKLPEIPGARLVKIDGLRAEFEQGWGLVRASNTTPSLLFRFEAESEVGLEQVQSIFRDMLTKVDPALQPPF